MVSFEFADEHEEFRKTLESFSEQVLLPGYRDRAASAEFPFDIYKKLGDLGVLGIGLPEEYGGTGHERSGPARPRHRDPRLRRCEHGRGASTDRTLGISAESGFEGGPRAVSAAADRRRRDDCDRVDRTRVGIGCGGPAHHRHRRARRVETQRREDGHLVGDERDRRPRLRTGSGHHALDRRELFRRPLDSPASAAAICPVWGVCHWVGALCISRMSSSRPRTSSAKRAVASSR